MATPARIKLPLPQSLQNVEDVLLWRNPVTSGAILGGITVLYLLLEWSGIPMLAWLSNVVLVALLGTLIWAQVAKVLNKPGPGELLPPVFRTGIDEATWRSVSEKLRGAANAAFAAAGCVLSGNDIAASLKAAGVVFLIGWAGRLMSPIGLAYTTVLAAFSLPKAYEMRKDDVDASLATAKRTLDDQYGKLSAQANDLYTRLTPRKGPAPPKEE